jgi:hypothetical protein
MELALEGRVAEPPREEQTAHAPDVRPVAQSKKGTTRQELSHDAHLVSSLQLLGG